MPHQMLMQKVIYTYSLADAALLPRRDSENSWIHVAEGDQAL